MSKYCYLNGRIVQEGEANISIKDIAIGRGYGIFDYFQVKDGRPVHMEYHLARFRRSAELMKLKVDINEQELSETIMRLLARNEQKSAGVKLIATGGKSPNGFDIADGSLAIVLFPYYSVPNEQVENGVKLLSYEYQRLLPHIKSINYLYAVYLSDELKKAGAIEPLYYTRESVRETARANIMAVKDGVLVTSADKVLEGITRKTIIEQVSLPVELRDIPMEELLSADEVFLCGTTKRALGVVQIDDHIIGNGRPGPVTMEVRKQLLDLENSDPGL